VREPYGEQGIPNERRGYNAKLCYFERIGIPLPLCGIGISEKAAPEILEEYD
jgi:hypothetical protein